MKVISLVSGGIDSAVATALAIEQGYEVIAVHMSNAPFSDEKAREKTEKLVEFLAKKYNKKIKLHVVPHGKSLTEIARKTERKLTCVLCRRMMLRVAEKVAEMEKADAILTGESLGQVASQTLPNLSAEAGATKFPIIRPLLGMDKNEIMRYARGLETYEISILPGMCCEITPDKPATKATSERVEREEIKMDLDSLVEIAVKGEEVKVFG